MLPGNRTVRRCHYIVVRLLFGSVYRATAARRGCLRRSRHLGMRCGRWARGAHGKWALCNMLEELFDGVRGLGSVTFPFWWRRSRALTADIPWPRRFRVLVSLVAFPFLPPCKRPCIHSRRTVARFPHMFILASASFALDTC